MNKLKIQKAELETKNEESASLPTLSQKDIKLDKVLSKIEEEFMGSTAMTMNAMMKNKTRDKFIAMTKGTDIDLSGVSTRNDIQRIIDDIRKPSV